jgi:hypothetical protein
MNVFNKYGMPVLMVINAIAGVYFVAGLFSVTATPMTAFLAVVYCFGTIGGIVLISKERSDSVRSF